MKQEVRVPPDGAVCPGVDVSFYQQNTDWNAVKAGGLVFAFIKATEGVHYSNPIFVSDSAAAKAAGILRAPYHFYHPEKDAKVQAQNFSGAVKSATTLCGPFEMPPMFDWEVSQGMKPAVQVSGALTILDKMEEEFGQIPIIYTNQKFFNDLSKQADTTQFVRYPLFISDWHAKAPLIPDTWLSVGWRFWQGSNSGVVRGFPKPVDTDLFNGSAQDLMEWIGK